MNRRGFLKSGAAALAATALGPYVAYAADQKPLRVGLIGCGWYGKSDLFRLLQVAPIEIVSLCDVDKNMLDACADRAAATQPSGKRPRTYGDYRQMLKEKDLDIVEVATPDHWHALAMIAAVESGADIYVQKPISVDIAEGQAMLAAARKHNRVVQVGTQRRSTPHLIEARQQIVKSGMLGTVRHAEIYCYYHMRARDNPPDEMPPANFDYEMWTGPAPMRPYNKLVHPKKWRAFMEYGNGIIGDMCIHMFDMVRWMLDLSWPNRVSSTGGILVEKQSRANISDTQNATFDFGDLQVVWEHRTWGDPPAGFSGNDKKVPFDPARPRWPWGATLYGDKGTLEASVMGYTFTPSGKGKLIHKEWVNEMDKYPEDKDDKELEVPVASAIRGHMRNLVECIDTREKPVADIEQGYISTASCILANLAMKTGRTLEWDPAIGRIVNDDDANKLLQRPYRSPWVHPADHKG